MTPETIDRYIIKGELGRGGMAAVFAAHDPRFERAVAVKVLPRALMHDPTFRARFTREARTIAALEHPAIVPVHDFGEADGQPFLVMRHMAGGSLADRLQSGPLDMAAATAVISRLAPALDAAHRHGIIHRDLKPGNILFDRYDQAYLADFGIVKTGEATAAYTGSLLIGTPTYMSPEQAHGNLPLDGRSDIYALGIILFEMLAGRAPFEADTPLRVAMKHVMETPPPIRTIRPDLPSDLERLLDRALAKEPADRYPIAGALAADLHEVASALTPYPRPDTLRTELIDIARGAAPSTASRARPGSAPKRRAGWRYTNWPVVVGLISLAFTLFLVAGLSADPAGWNDPTPTNTPTATPFGVTRVITPEPPVITVPLGPRPRPVVRSVGALDQGARVSALAWSPDSRILAVALPDGRLSLRDVASGAELLAPIAGVSPLHDVVWSPDGALIAAAAEDGSITLFLASTGELLTRRLAHEGAVTAVAWSPDGRRLASAGRDGTARLWSDSLQQQHRFDNHQDAVLSIAWAPDGQRLVTGGADGVALLWESDGDLLATARPHGSSVVAAVAFSPDGLLVASGGLDGRIVVWDAAGGQVLRQFAAHDRFVNTVTWSPDGAFLLSGGGDNRGRLWDVGGGVEAGELRGHDDVLLTVAWSPDGRRLATGSRDHDLIVWAFTPGQ